MPRRFHRTSLSRRDFFKFTGGAAAALAVSPAATVFAKPHTQLSGELRILQWSHFVPNYDKWFDQFARVWGEENGVAVTVDHIALADLSTRATAEISAGEGHDLIEMLEPPSALEPSLLDLTDVNEEAVARYGEQFVVCNRSSYNPTTNKYYGFCHGWVPDPGDYRKSLWEGIGQPNGPATWQDLLEGGTEILNSQGIQMGIGMSNEIDSNMAGRALMWSFGASIQDENEAVIINSPETIAAVEYMVQLFNQAMTPEIFGWTAASNNQLLIAGQASYILNSISAYRTAQKVNYEVADDIYFTRALTGPTGVGYASSHVIPVYMVPQHSQNPEAAKAFMLHLVANYNQATFSSELYNFPAWDVTAPQLYEENGWLQVDPFGSRPVDKLLMLGSAKEWTSNLGFPGPANPAEGEVYNTFIIPEMYAKAARGEMSPADAVAEAEGRIVAIFDKWRGEGLVGG